MNNEIFQKFYNKLNPEQKEAVDTLEGPVMVVAGPGTGKTQVLTLRIANIILQNKAKPEEILALTFTENAAGNMRRRLFEILGASAYVVNISTFHGFCNEIIRQNPDSFGLRDETRARNMYAEGRNVTEVDQAQILEEIIKNGNFEHFNLFNPYVNYIAVIKKAISDLKREGVFSDDYAAIVARAEKELAARDDLYHAKGRYKGKMKGEHQETQKRIERNKEFCEVYEMYRGKLAETGDYDYDDMILYVIQALRNDNDLLSRLRGDFRYLFVDEHQDANSAQNEVVELIAGEYAPNIFVVGDEKQAIFRFQGASLANILYFKNTYPACKIVTLQTNYRSHQKIIDSAQSVIRNNTERIGNYIEGIDDSLVAARADVGRQIEIYEPQTPEHEIYFVTEKIKELQAEGISANEIAVLYRENREGDLISEALSKEGIVHTVESSRSIFEDAAIRNFIALLSFASRRDLSVSSLRREAIDEELVKLLFIDFLRIPAFDVYKLVSLRADRRRLKNIFWIMSDRDLMKSIGIASADRIYEFSQNLSSWISAAASKNAPQAFELIARDSGFFEYIAAENSLERIGIFGKLFSELKSLAQRKSNFTLWDFVQHLNLLNRYSIALNQKFLRLPSNAVRLMTAHKAKGLEFDYVILSGCVDARWGGRKRPDILKLFQVVESPRDGSNDIEDNRRLFYVALTRARHGVCISAPCCASDGREQSKSRFIGEIKSELVARGDMSRYEKGLEETPSFFIRESKPSFPDVSDAEFLRGLFLKRGFSATALNNYLCCPWRYFYRNLLRLPEAQQPYLMYGNAVHRALESFFDKKGAGVDFLLAEFAKNLSLQSFLDIEMVRYKERGEKALAAYFYYYNIGALNKDAKTVNEFNVGSVMLDGEVRLTGTIDKIELRGEEANVVDYKTGRRKTRNELAGETKNSRGNEYRQLVFYKLLLDKLPDSPCRVNFGEIDFVEPEKRTGKFYKERFPISGEDVQKLEYQIQDVTAEILGLAFWNKRCEDKRCEYCKLRQMTHED